MQQQDELFEPAEYLDQNGPGYFSILAFPGGLQGKPKNSAYEVQHLPAVINGLNPNHDTYLSQATFDKPNRRAVNAQGVGLCFIDLDTHHRPDLAGRTPEQQATMLVNYCALEGIPAPSVVIFSGRGLHAKWFLTDAVSRPALMEWNNVQRALVATFTDFGSDANARDISRVLRLDRTINTKTGERCRVVYVGSGVENCPTHYAFKDLQTILLPRLPQEVPEPYRSALAGASSIMSPEQMERLKTLAWTRMTDIQRLWELRGGVAEGYRETTLFWQLNFMLLAHPGRTRDIWREAQSLAANIDKAPGWYRNSDLGVLYRRAQEMTNGDGTEYNGRKYPKLYTPTNTTLIERFEITPDEEQRMDTIISRCEKVRRRREKRWAEGTTPQPYRHSKPWEELGVSRQWFYKLRQAGKV